MLLSTQRYSAGDIVCFKLVNGDEVVVCIKTDTNDEFVVTKPCTVLPSPKGIGLVQSLFTAVSETEIHLRRDHVLMHSEVVKEISDYYLQTVTGIKPTSASGIIT
jgi:hypothetical protein